jgi:hypothetical protein
MEKTQKIKAFEEELKFIVNPQIKLFAETTIGSLPDYFFEVPASSTGKYHPSYSLGIGGLLRHTRAAVRIAVELSRIEWWNFTPDEMDLILVSLILHDGWKSGLPKQEFSVADHPNVAVFALKQQTDLQTLITPEQFEFVTDNIKAHMGQWNRDWKTKQEIMEKPKTKYQKFVHLCDYIASRKSLEMNFDAEISKS